ncbi:midasin [Cajanus cajan]|uniref:midasin n=1 Tax=Cajanus cajan TaxID=3821 RepID=UPI00098D79F2|nr:midasin [Cajanus cajan]
MDEKAKKKGGKDVEVMNSNIPDGKEVQFLDDNQERKMKKRKKYDSSLDGMQESDFSKPSKKMRKVNGLKNNKGEDDDQHKQIKKSGGESQHKDYNEDKDGSHYEKKKKKSSKESKSQVYNEFESKEGGDDDQGKHIKKIKKSGDESQHKDYNEDKNDSHYKKKKKKTSSKESKSQAYGEFESKEGDQPSARVKSIVTEVEDQSKTETKKKAKADTSESPNPGHSGSSKPKRATFSDQVDVCCDGLVRGKSQACNEFERNEGGDGDQGKKMKKKKSGEDSQHVDYDEFKSNEAKNDGQHKKEEKRKKKKLSEESKSKYNEFKSNEDDGQGKKMKKKKLHDKSKNKENSELNSNEGDQPSARVKSIVTEVDDQSKTETKKKAKADTSESPNPGHSGSSKPKRVTFSDQVDVCCDGLVRGKRFTPEEDKRIELAVFDYIESHGLGDEGLDMVLNCIHYPAVRDCWKEIGLALPERPQLSVYNRAHVLFERSEKRGWTPEELEFLRKMKEQHGSDWKSVAVALGKHRFHVKDAWRRIKSADANKGRWIQEEYQKLFDLVNVDLRGRASQVHRKTKHGMLRDNIGWEAIGDKFTRSSSSCCEKWYNKLTSPMVAHGVWSDTDDYRLVNALFTLDACCMEEVDWDNLIENRSGDVCRKRWNQMVQCIGEHGGKSFAEQIEILAKRFCPDLLEVREAFDAIPVSC